MAKLKDVSRLMEKLTEAQEANRKHKERIADLESQLESREAELAAAREQAKAAA